MRWNEELQQLITCGKDKTIKVWQLPERWIDESVSSTQKQEKEEDSDSPQKFTHGIDDDAWTG